MIISSVVVVSGKWKKKLLLIYSSTDMSTIRIMVPVDSDFSSHLDNRTLFPIQLFTSEKKSEISLLGAF